MRVPGLKTSPQHASYIYGGALPNENKRDRKHKGIVILQSNLNKE